MKTAKLFQNGRFQAVRLPTGYRLPGSEVRISRQGEKVILEPLEQSWDDFFEVLSRFSYDFMEDGRSQPPKQQRDAF